MTHSNHRQGTYANLADDFVVLGFPGRPFDDLDATLRRFRDIGAAFKPVNVRDVSSVLSPRHLVYDSPDKACSCVAELARAGLGLSVIVSGLGDKVRECCRATGLQPHTIAQSLGFWGRVDRLPDRRVLEVTTMCGHGRISPELVLDVAGRIGKKKAGADAAAQDIGKLCLCNIFNPVRASRLLTGLAADLEAGRLAPGVVYRAEPFAKETGMTIDQARCTGCMECLSYCPSGAIADSGQTASIDPERCLECGVCYQSGVCPADAFVPRDILWPRTLRAKFQGPYGPYRAGATFETQPVAYGGEVRIYTHGHLPSELTNDVTGRLKPGEVAVAAEVGRPHIGATFLDVQEVVQAMLPFGLKLEWQHPVLDERRPVTDLMTDPARGVFRPDILDERLGWMMLKLVVPERQAADVLKGLQQAAGEVGTVLAVNIISRPAPDGPTLGERLAKEIGVASAPNYKTNLGLGRPLAQ